MIIIDKNGPKDGRWCTKRVREGYKVGFWKAQKDGLETFLSSVGSKNMVMFWKDS